MQIYLFSRENLFILMSSIDHLEDPDVDGRIILRWIFMKWGLGIWNESSWLRIGTCGGHL
jgi:hypothetical protein